MSTRRHLNAVLSIVYDLRVKLYQFSAIRRDNRSFSAYAHSHSSQIHTDSRAQAEVECQKRAKKTKAGWLASRQTMYQYNNNNEMSKRQNNNNNKNAANDVDDDDVYDGDDDAK